MMAGCMTFYCTNCWSLVAESRRICPSCGDDIPARQARADYADKLIAALHTESSTSVHAAWILGERREQKAVGRLARLVAESPDMYIVEAAIEALGKIGGENAWQIVSAAMSHPRLRARWRAELAVAQWRRNKS